MDVLIALVVRVLIPVVVLGTGYLFARFVLRIEKKALDADSSGLGCVGFVLWAVFGLLAWLAISLFR